MKIKKSQLERILTEEITNILLEQSRPSLDLTGFMPEREPEETTPREYEPETEYSHVTSDPSTHYSADLGYTPAPIPQFTRVDAEGRAITEPDDPDPPQLAHFDPRSGQVVDPTARGLGLYGTYEPHRMRLETPSEERERYQREQEEIRTPMEDFEQGIQRAQGFRDEHEARQTAERERYRFFRPTSMQGKQELAAWEQRQQDLEPRHRDEEWQEAVRQGYVPSYLHGRPGERGMTEADPYEGTADFEERVAAADDWSGGTDLRSWLGPEQEQYRFEDTPLANLDLMADELRMPGVEYEHAGPSFEDEMAQSVARQAWEAEHRRPVSGVTGYDPESIQGMQQRATWRSGRTSSWPESAAPDRTPGEQLRYDLTRPLSASEEQNLQLYGARGPTPGMEFWNELRGLIPWGGSWEEYDVTGEFNPETFATETAMELIPGAFGLASIRGPRVRPLRFRGGGDVPMQRVSPADEITTLQNVPRQPRGGADPDVLSGQHAAPGATRLGEPQPGGYRASPDEMRMGGAAARPGTIDRGEGTIPGIDPQTGRSTQIRSDQEMGQIISRREELISQGRRDTPEFQELNDLVADQERNLALARQAETGTPPQGGGPTQMGPETPAARVEGPTRMTQPELDELTRQRDALQRDVASRLEANEYAGPGSDLRGQIDNLDRMTAQIDQARAPRPQAERPTPARLAPEEMERAVARQQELQQVLGDETRRPAIAEADYFPAQERRQVLQRKIQEGGFRSEREMLGAQRELDELTTNIDEFEAYNRLRFEADELADRVELTNIDNDLVELGVTRQELDELDEWSFTGERPGTEGDPVVRPDDWGATPHPFGGDLDITSPDGLPPGDRMRGLFDRIINRPPTEEDIANYLARNRGSTMTRSDAVNNIMREKADKLTRRRRILTGRLSELRVGGRRVPIPGLIPITAATGGVLYYLYANPETGEIDPGRQPVDVDGNPLVNPNTGEDVRTEAELAALQVFRGPYREPEIVSRSAVGSPEHAAALETVIPNVDDAGQIIPQPRVPWEPPQGVLDEYANQYQTNQEQVQAHVIDSTRRWDRDVPVSELYDLIQDDRGNWYEFSPANPETGQPWGWRNVNPTNVPPNDPTTGRSRYAIPGYTLQEGLERGNLLLEMIEKEMNRGNLLQEMISQEINGLFNT